jgi:hypothetical protein
MTGIETALSRKLFVRNGAVDRKRHARSRARSSPSFNCHARHSLVSKKSLCPQTLSSQVDFIVVPLAKSVAWQLPED